MANTTRAPTRVDNLNVLGKGGATAGTGTVAAPTQEELLEKLMERFEEVNTFYIEAVARQIRTIGELNAASMHRIEIFAQMNEDIAEINQRLADATQMAKRDLLQLYDKALNDMYHDPRFERALQETPLPEADKERVNQMAQAVARQTMNTMDNLSNTTAVSEDYRKAVDKAILANAAGLDTYKALTRQAVRELGYNGMQVQYASGYHRRLDSALRQNIIDGTNQIAQHSSDMMGEALGYNAREISAHLASAPDHEPVQGRVFLLAEFDKMQSGQPFTGVDGKHYEGFRRPISEWNCMHFAMSFDTERSIRKYTDDQLRQWAEQNAEGCEINGKHYTLYQARQLMRRIETQVRREKDTANAAREAGDDELRQKCQERINRLSQRYTQVAKASGFRQRRDRMTVEGFQPVKAQTQPEPSAGNNGLTGDKGDGTIGDEKLPQKESMTNEEARRWYIDHDKKIPDMVDKRLPIEQQARQAHELRNSFRTQTRDLMQDQELRKQLDRERPNRTFEETLESKMLRKGMTREEAIEDILKTATKTNKEVNEKLGLEG